MRLKVNKVNKVIITREGGGNVNRLLITKSYTVPYAIFSRKVQSSEAPPLPPLSYQWRQKMAHEFYKL